MIKFRCGNCDEVSSVGDDCAGRPVKCPKCRCFIRVPSRAQGPVGEAGQGEGSSSAILLGSGLLDTEASPARPDGTLEPEPLEEGPRVEGQIACPVCRAANELGAQCCADCGYNFGTRASFSEVEEEPTVDARATMVTGVKWLVILGFAALVVWIIFKAVGIESSQSLFKARERNPRGKNFNEVMAEDNNVEDIVGCALPETVEGVSSRVFLSDRFGRDRARKFGWVVARLPKEDFNRLVEGLGLVHGAGLHDFWPGAFDCAADELNEFWNLAKVVDEDTYFGDSSDEGTYRMFKYAGGKLYVKKETRYVKFAEEKGRHDYVREGRPILEYMSGVDFPTCANDVCFDDWLRRDKGSSDYVYTNWAVAELPKAEFSVLVQKLELEQRADLLEIWPDAFEWGHGPTTRPESHEFHPAWDVSGEVSDDTYCWEHDEREIRLMLKYENGRLYMKRVTVFVSAYKGAIGVKKYKQEG